MVLVLASWQEWKQVVGSPQALQKALYVLDDMAEGSAGQAGWLWFTALKQQHEVTLASDARV